MRRKKGNNGIIIIFMGVIIVILAVLCVLFATGKLSFNSEGNTVVNENENKDKTDVLDNDSLVGEYYYVSNDGVDTEVVLGLMNNGMFYYFSGAPCFNVGSGKYEISNKKLILNYSFKTSCSGFVYMKENRAVNEEVNTYPGTLEQQSEYVINGDHSLANEFDKKIVKTSDSYDHFNYYNDMISGLYASSLQSKNNS